MNRWLLSRLYRYGFAAYVGGSFTEGSPHSVVEPACYGMPVAFGPRYQRETHCKDLVRLGAGFPVADGAELERFYEQASGDPAFRDGCAQRSRAYCQDSAGATRSIMEIIFNSR